MNNSPINNARSGSKTPKNTTVSKEEESPKDDNAPTVIDKKTGRRMKVMEITHDGKLVCSDDLGIVEEFAPNEVDPTDE